MAWSLVAASARRSVTSLDTHVVVSTTLHVESTTQSETDDACEADEKPVSRFTGSQEGTEGQAVRRLPLCEFGASAALLTSV